MKIEVKNLSKSFKKNEILKDINLNFESGKIYGLYGRNGSGKSVFLKILCGFYVPTKGNVLYDGQDLNSTNQFPNFIRALIERPAFFPDMSGYDNLKILANIQKRIGQNEILEALDTVNLINEKDKKYGKYSLGMKQKLGIAQAIMENPEVIILDEPFNGIEGESVKKIADYLIKKKNEGKIIILSSHIKDDLKFLCDKIILFEDGKILKDKNINEL